MPIACSLSERAIGFLWRYGKALYREGKILFSNLSSRETGFEFRETIARYAFPIPGSGVKSLEYVFLTQSF